MVFRLRATFTLVAHAIDIVVQMILVQNGFQGGDYRNPDNYQQWLKQFIGAARNGP